MLHPLLLLLSLCAPPSFAQATSGSPSGQAEQRDLPGYVARASRAESQLKAAQAYLKGERTLESAWPHLRGGDWLDPSWLAGRMALLDADARSRALEARSELAPQDQELSTREQQRLSRARTRALSAEESAQGLERKVLLAMQALLQTQPGLERAALDTLLEELDTTRGQALLRWQQCPEQERPQAALALARVDQERAAFEGLDAELVATAARPGYTLKLDAAGLSDPLRASWTAHRLSLLMPLSDGATSPALLDWLSRERERVSALPPMEPGELEALQAQLDGLQEHQGADPISSAWRALDALERARLLDCIERSQAVMQESVQAEEMAALQEADQARLDAERAVESATDSEARWVAQVLTAVSQDYDRAAQYKEDLEAQSASSALERSQARERLDTLEAEIAVAMALPSLGTQRDRDLGGAYVSLRGHIQDLRRAAIAADTLGQQRAELAERVEREATASQAQLALDRSHAESLSRQERAEMAGRLDTWEEVIGAMRVIARLERERSLQHQTEVMELLEEAKAQRRVLAGEVSSEVRMSDRALLPEELQLELRVVLPRMLTLGRSRLSTLRENMSSVTFWGTLSWGLLRLGVGVLLWRWLRERLPLVARRVVDFRTKDMRRLERIANEQLHSPLTRSLRALLDLLVVWLLLRPTEEFFPEAGLALLIWWQYLLFALLVQLYELTVARYPSTRPALVHVTDAGWRLGERTLRVAAAWLIARQFATYLCLELLNADALYTLVNAIFGVALVVLTLLLLHAWEPTLRSQLRRQGGDDLIRSYLTSEPAQPRLTRWARAAVDIVLLSFATLWRHLQFRASEGSALGRALNLFYRYSMSDKQEEQGSGPAIDKELQQRILDTDTAPSTRVEREQLDKDFYTALKAWESDSAQGTLALVGDRGSGMGTWLDHLAEDLAGRGLGLRHLSIKDRLNTQDSVVRWVAQELDLSDCSGLQAIEDALLERPPSVFILEHCERAFLRCVGGFDGMRALLELVGRCGERHFWVLGFHLPAWAYISRLDRLLKVHLFHHVLKLPPMSEAQLHQLVVSRTEAAGFQMDFRDLLRGGALSGDVEGELKRATSAFFRVLGEASHGNPAVALRLWVESLRHGEHGALRVRMGSALSEPLIDGLGEPELFLLAAIRMQASLSEPELAQVNNMNATAVRSSVQVLRGRGLVHMHQGQVSIPIRQQSTVTRTLWRRNLLDWRG